MKIYSCNYLKVGSGTLTVYSVIYHDDVAGVLLAIIFLRCYFITSPVLLLFAPAI